MEFKQNEINKIYCGDSLEVLKTFPDDSIDCIITSPPYYGLRLYSNDKKEIGREQTPEEYVYTLVHVFNEAKRVLKKEGICWLNLGDSYYNYRPGKGQSLIKQTIANNKQDLPDVCARRANKLVGLKEKDLIGIPWRIAFALQADGWYLRQDIIWAKNNPMPESVTDRCTKSHEYVFLLTKSPKYYFDNVAIKEPTVTRNKTNRDRDSTRLNNTPGRTKMSGLKTNDYETRNKRDVWNINTKPFREAHFATFPEALVEPMIKAGCPKEGIVLDPFIGSGTTGVVAKKLGRNYIGIELSPAYITIAEKRLAETTKQLSLI